MPSLIQGNSTTVTVLAGQSLTVIAEADSTGSVSRLGDTPGSEPQGVTAITENTTTVKGPYSAPTRFLIECVTGTLTYSIAPLDVAGYVADAIAGLPADAVTPLTDSTGGTPGATLAAVGDTSAGDESDAINDNFASLNQQLEDLKTSLVAAGLLTQYVEP